jgi:hypothetical protein
MTTIAETVRTIEALRDSLPNRNSLHETWTSGVVILSEPAKSLFYEKKDGTSK